jgi:trehalose 6-phosphate synthase/phosphatase
MTGLKNIRQKQQTFQEIFLDEYSRRGILDNFRKATRRLLLLDYDGTLISFASSPELAVPGASLLALLSSLGRKRGTEVYLISGRSSSWLEKYFGSLPINLIAEHGAKCRLEKNDWNTEVQTHSEWKEQVHNIMEMYVRRCPQTFVEEKEFSIVWHYRNANTELGKLKAKELSSELNEYLHNRHLQVMQGKKILARHSYDFIFAVGDDKTDEDMFKTLVGKPNCFTIKVGPNASYAQYNLLKPQMVISLLEDMEQLNVISVVQ